MAEFHDHLDLRAYGAKRWKLLTRYRYTTDLLGGSVLLGVPKGFITDLASIPRVVRSLVPQVGRHRGAAVIHDWLYATANIHDFSRRLCDRIFLEAMKVAGVPWYRRHMMYQAVRCGGWVFFNKQRRKK